MPAAAAGAAVHTSHACCCCWCCRPHKPCLLQPLVLPSTQAMPAAAGGACGMPPGHAATAPGVLPSTQAAFTKPFGRPVAAHGLGCPLRSRAGFRDSLWATRCFRDLRDSLLPLGLLPRLGWLRDSDASAMQPSDRPQQRRRPTGVWPPSVSVAVCLCCGLPRSSACRPAQPAQPRA